MGFLKLFWGFIFLFDLNIKGVDILPDVLGYTFFYLGLRQLRDVNSNFQVAKKIAFSLIFLSVFDIFLTIYSESLLITSIALFELIYVIISLIMVYRIISGIAELAKKSYNFNLETKAINTWRLFFGFNVLVIIYIIIPLSILSWLITFFSVFIYLIIFNLLNDAKNKISLPKKRRVYYTL